ncbi:actin-related protein T3 [Carlito syrichta]|uniref:Actin-related protein T3 n=1 Tax=Carlito syrichta TaxID=1868482 RepID=A0A1U7STI3_CARSF|nr:actin-related protein T3 [Carlito syrichta]
MRDVGAGGSYLEGLGSRLELRRRLRLRRDPPNFNKEMYGEGRPIGRTRYSPRPAPRTPELLAFGPLATPAPGPAESDSEMRFWRALRLDFPPGWREPRRVEGAQAECTQVEGEQVERAQVEDAQVKGGQVEDAQVKGGQVEGEQVEGVRVEDAQVEGGQVEGEQVEDAQVEGGQVEEQVKGAQVEREPVGRENRRRDPGGDYPVERGLVVSWEDMETMWRHTYHSLSLQPSDSPVLLTEPALNPLASRQQTAEVFFEQLGVPAFYMSIQAVLALFAAGFTTGLVLDSGAGLTQSVPVFEGYCLPHGVQQLGLAGLDLTHHLMLLVQSQGIMLLRGADRRVLEDIKETCCYVAMDFDEELVGKPDSLEKVYRLPDGKVLRLREPLFHCPEALFSPRLAGLEALGVDKMCLRSVLRCDADLRPALFSNIVLAGGSTIFPGFDKRLVRDVVKAAPASTPVQVTAPPERKLSVWMGGSILASLSAFQDMWIRAEEFKEVGPNVVHQRCF